MSRPPQGPLEGPQGPGSRPRSPTPLRRTFAPPTERFRGPSEAPRRIQALHLREARVDAREAHGAKASRRGLRSLPLGPETQENSSKLNENLRNSSDFHPKWPQTSMTHRSGWVSGRYSRPDPRGADWLRSLRVAPSASGRDYMDLPPFSSIFMMIFEDSQVEIAAVGWKTSERRPSEACSKSLSMPNCLTSIRNRRTRLACRTWTGCDGPRC